MAFPLFRRTNNAGTIASLYGAIVAQARQPFFYTTCGVPDTAEGRFEMVVLHVALFFRRVRTEGASGRALGQELFDLFCNDMESNLREMGVSDAGVPKKMRSVGEAFYGRAAAYEAALQSADRGALAIAVARNVLGDESADAGRLADYIGIAVDELAVQDIAALAAGRVRFPDAAVVLADARPA